MCSIRLTIRLLARLIFETTSSDINAGRTIGDVPELGSFAFLDHELLLLRGGDGVHLFGLHAIALFSGLSHGA